MLLPETLILHNKSYFEFHYAYFLPWKDQMVNSIQQQGGKVICFDANNNIQLMMKLRAVSHYVRANDIQLIHAHLPWAGILARVVGKICKVPVLYTEHNKQERYHFGTRIMNLLTMDLLTEVIAVSTDVSESIQRNKPRLRTTLRTIPNGVNIQNFNKQSFDGRLVFEKLGIPPGALLIGTVAVFRVQKRLDLWMELAAKILQQFGDAHFIIVGDGPLKNELILKRDALGLTDRVHMPGLETEVRPYFAAFDVYMMSSIFEGLPVALLEAMAMQCPVIATDAGGIKEVIRHNVDGLLCSVENPDMLVEYACTLLNDKELRVRFGDQARRRAIENFSMEKMVSELEVVYEDVAKRFA